jgi:hypothetical protein
MATAPQLERSTMSDRNDPPDDFGGPSSDTRGADVEETTNPFEIICAASGDRAEAETAGDALVAADTLARDAADTGAQGSLRAARRTLYVTEHGTYNGLLTEFARRGVRDLPAES